MKTIPMTLTVLEWMAILSISEFYTNRKRPTIRKMKVLEDRESIEPGVLTAIAVEIHESLDVIMSPYAKSALSELNPDKKVTIDVSMIHLLYMFTIVTWCRYEAPDARSYELLVCVSVMEIIAEKMVEIKGDPEGIFSKKGEAAKDYHINDLGFYQKHAPGGNKPNSDVDGEGEDDKQT